MTQMTSSQLKEARAAANRLPNCSGCGSHIGSATGICGACKNPQRLTWRECLRLGRLARDHWHGGSVTKLVLHPSYRPKLNVSTHISLALSDDAESRKAAVQELNERAEFADLYDRSQAQRGLRRRAVRI